MAEWTTVAQGASLSDLNQLVADMDLKKGTRIRVMMQTPVDWVFDLAGAELVFQPYVPVGVDLIDVWGENGYGIVEMEADPIWLVALLGFIRANWIAIIIGGFVLATIVTFAIMVIKIAQVLSGDIWKGAVVLGSVAIIAWALYARGLYARGRSP